MGVKCLYTRFSDSDNKEFHMLFLWARSSHKRVIVISNKNIFISLDGNIFHIDEERRKYYNILQYCIINRSILKKCI